MFKVSDIENFIFKNQRFTSHPAWGYGLSADEICASSQYTEPVSPEVQQTRQILREIDTLDTADNQGGYNGIGDIRETDRQVNELLDRGNSILPSVDTIEDLTAMENPVTSPGQGDMCFVHDQDCFYVYDQDSGWITMAQALVQAVDEHWASGHVQADYSSATVNSASSSDLPLPGPDAIATNSNSITANSLTAMYENISNQMPQPNTMIMHPETYRQLVEGLGNSDSIEGSSGTNTTQDPSGTDMVDLDIETAYREQLPRMPREHWRPRVQNRVELETLRSDGNLAMDICYVVDEQSTYIYNGQQWKLFQNHHSSNSN